MAGQRSARSLFLQRAGHVRQVGGGGWFAGGSGTALHPVTGPLLGGGRRACAGEEFERHTCGPGQGFRKKRRYVGVSQNTSTLWPET